MDPAAANIRPGTPQANCSMCDHFEAGTNMCEALGVPTKPELLCDLYTPETGDMEMGGQEALINKLFGGPSG